MSDELFFSYDAVRNNCQRYVDTLLSVSGTSRPELHAFVLQEVTGLLTHSTPRVALDLGLGRSRSDGGQQGAAVIPIFSVLR